MLGQKSLYSSTAAQGLCTGAPEEMSLVYCRARDIHTSHCPIQGAKSPSARAKAFMKPCRPLLSGMSAHLYLSDGMQEPREKDTVLQ